MEKPLCLRDRVVHHFWISNPGTWLNSLIETSGIQTTSVYILLFAEFVTETRLLPTLVAEPRSGAPGLSAWDLDFKFFTLTFPCGPREHFVRFALMVR